MAASNASDEPSVVPNRAAASEERAFGYNAAAGTCGDWVPMGVIDPARVLRLALQNAGSIAGRILTNAGLIAHAPAKADAEQHPLSSGAGPDL